MTGTCAGPHDLRRACCVHGGPQTFGGPIASAMAALRTPTAGGALDPWQPFRALSVDLAKVLGKRSHKPMVRRLHTTRHTPKKGLGIAVLLHGCARVVRGLAYLGRMRARARMGRVAYVEEPVMCVPLNLAALGRAVTGARNCAILARPPAGQWRRCGTTPGPAPQPTHGATPIPNVIRLPYGARTPPAHSAGGGPAGGPRAAHQDHAQKGIGDRPHTLVLPAGCGSSDPMRVAGRARSCRSGSVRPTAKSMHTL